MVYRSREHAAGGTGDAARAWSARSSPSRSTGASHPITSRRVVVGRSRECDVQVDDTNVSRRHCELVQEDATYWVVDLGSTNGTELNGRVGRSGRKLSDGDRITIGATDLVFGRIVRDLRRSTPTRPCSALKVAFLVLLYVFVWLVVRCATRDLRAAPQESIILSAQEAAARRGHGTRCRARSSSWSRARRSRQAPSWS